MLGCKYWPIVITSTWLSRRSCIVCTTSSFTSPKPSIMPLLVRMPPCFNMRRVSILRQYFACMRTCLVSLSTVSILWDTTSGAASIIRCMFSVSALKSGIKVSKVVVGFKALMALIVLYQMIEPPSFISSLSTEVTTACFTFIRLMASATRCGSSQSTGNGLPVATAQKPQLRVQIFPNIINVAVPSPQHSPMFGQLPLSQMVCNLWVSTKFLTCLKSSPMGSFTLSQSGFFTFTSTTPSITGNSVIH